MITVADLRNTLSDSLHRMEVLTLNLEFRLATHVVELRSLAEGDLDDDERKWLDSPKRWDSRVAHLLNMSDGINRAAERAQWAISRLGVLNTRKLLPAPKFDDDLFVEVLASMRDGVLAVSSVGLGYKPSPEFYMATLTSATTAHEDGGGENLRQAYELLERARVRLNHRLPRGWGLGVSAEVSEIDLLGPEQTDSGSSDTEAPEEDAEEPQEVSDESPEREGPWFEAATGRVITCEALRSQKRRGQITFRKVSGRLLYKVQDVKDRWPQCAEMIQSKMNAELPERSDAA